MLAAIATTILATNLMAAAPKQEQQDQVPPVIGTSGKAFRNPITRVGDLIGPEDISFVYYFTGTGNEIRPLEPARGILRRVQLLTSTRFGMKVPGERSPVRFKRGKVPTFLVTILPFQQLPTKWECFVLDIRGDRFLPFINSGIVDVGGPRGVHVRVSTYVGDVYRLKLEDIPPGEYAFKYGVDTEEKDLYCFAVDAE